jgi:UDP-glucuronate 4-epimerase
MENVIITGGAGFIGSHLSQRLLREGKRLAIIDNFDDFYSPEFKRKNLEEVKSTGDFQYFPADIRDAEKLREIFAAFKPDTVIHLAARPGVRLSFAQPEAYTSINVLGTTQLLEVTRQSGVRRFLMASSSSVYGHSGHAPFREDAVITQPLSIYAATKVAGEAVAFTYAHAYGLSVACVRLFTAYGPRQRPDLAIRKFAALILKGEEVPIFGEGKLLRDYTYIEDIVEGITRAAHATGSFDVYNIGNAHPLSIREMVERLAEALGKPARLKYLPAPAGEMQLTHADLTKARQCLGYEPKVSFDEGIRRFAEWFKAQK